MDIRSSFGLFLPVIASSVAIAQDSVSFRLSGYAEVYYTYDFGRPENGERPEFLYNHKRHNEFNANLALIRGSYERERVRGAIGLMAGNYVQYNMVAEPEGLQNIYEARVGLRLLKDRELWIDAGIFPSHIGFESAIGMDCRTLTRSLVAENSPYYEAGAVLSYRPNDRWLFAGMVLNGWQRIQREPGNQRPAFGTQLQFDNGEGTVLNWSTFIGSMGPDSTGEWRVYNNFYAQNDGDNYGMVLGVDVGIQESHPSDLNEEQVSGWFTVVGIYRQRIAGHWWGVGRIEYFLDDEGLVMDPDALLGGSLGVDLRLGDHAAWRVEGRFLGSGDEVFTDANGSPIQTNMALTSALCLSF
jgi:hypothetical protein